MKVSFDKLSPDYLGDYMQEYKKAGFLKVVYGKDAMKQRGKIKSGDLLNIDISNSKFADFVIEQARADNSKTASDFNKIANGAIFKMQRLISLKDYQAIESILEQFSPSLKDYTDDFALMVIYARDEVFEKHQQKKERLVISDTLRLDVRNFFVGIFSRDNINVKKITIDYSNADKNKKLHIDAPVLMKMMLYEFGRKYYTFIEGADEYNWESMVDIYYEKPKRGNKGHDYTPELKAIVHVGKAFIDSEKIFGDAVDAKYALLGKLFSLVGFAPYRPNRDNEYENESDYYSKSLKKYRRK